MKRFLKTSLALIAVAVALFSLAACGILDVNNGENGLSAYEIAVKNGFVGSEKEWLESLSGNATIIQNNTTFNVNGENGQLIAACNTGIKSVASIYSSFTKLSYVGSGWHFEQQEISYTSAGSGVFYRLEENGSAFVITNHHVVYDSESLTANKISNNISVFLYGMESAEYAIPATYVGSSMYYDIAVLKISNNDILKTAVKNRTVQAVEFANSDIVTVGQTSIAIGNPEAEGISVASGIISVDSEYIEMTAVDNKTKVSYRVMRTDTAINSGNSGGGLFDTSGKLIGIVNAKMNSNQAENIAYAIPANLAKNVADNIIANCANSTCENVRRAMLGITTTVVAKSTELDSQGLVRKTETVAISDVAQNSLAQGVLQKDDILVNIKLHGTETAVTRMYHVTESLLTAQAGDTVTLTVLRNGKTETLNITITQDCLTDY